MNYSILVLSFQPVHFRCVHHIISLFDERKIHRIFSDQEVQVYPPVGVITNPFKPKYLKTLPWVTASGFAYCFKLAVDAPNLAIQNLRLRTDTHSIYLGSLTPLVRGGGSTISTLSHLKTNIVLEKSKSRVRLKSFSQHTDMIVGFKVPGRES